MVSLLHDKYCAQYSALFNVLTSRVLRGDDDGAFADSIGKDAGDDRGRRQGKRKDHECQHGLFCEAVANSGPVATTDATCLMPSKATKSFQALSLQDATELRNEQAAEGMSGF
jgi:hypothetical protein